MVRKQPKTEEPAAPAPPQKTEPEVRLITQEQAVLNSLEHVMHSQAVMHNMILEGFKKLGVNFDGEKQEEKKD